MSSLGGPLQTAIYGVLTGDATLMGMVRGVYDNVTQGTAFPYITIGENELRDWSTYGLLGQKAKVHIHVWSQKTGRKESHDILSRVDTLLNRATLSVTGGLMVAMVRDMEQVMLDPDGLTYHGVQRYDVLLTT